MIVAPLAIAVLITLAMPPLVASRAGRALDDFDLPVARSVEAPRARSWTRHRHRTRVEPGAVAAWCDDLARGLRHGSTLRAVLIATVPDSDAVAAATDRLRHRLDRGATVVEACDGWSADLSDQSAPGADHLATFATLLAAVATLGGNTAEPIDRFAIAMRQRTSDDLERESNSAQARMSARVLTIVPLAVLALLLATDADVRRVMTTPAGAIILVLGLSFNAVGAVWMHRIAGGPAGESVGR